MMNLIKQILRRLSRPSPAQVKFKPVYIPAFESSLLLGRRAFITGATGDIGMAMAEAFLKSGASVVVGGRNQDKLEKVVAQLSHFGQVTPCLIDVCHPETFSDTVDSLGDFDILVNNAGYVIGGAFGQTQVSEYDKVLETNLRGAYFLSQEVGRKWISNGIQGNILNVCSASSLRPGNSPYILSKWGLRSLTLGMARDLIAHGIVVNGIAPGCTNTTRFCAPEREDIDNPKNPSKRLVTTQEIANLSVVMVSGLARMVVGDVLYVTGGGAITTFDD